MAMINDHKDKIAEQRNKVVLLFFLWTVFNKWNISENCDKLKNIGSDALTFSPLV